MSSEKKAQPLCDDELEQVGGRTKEVELTQTVCPDANNLTASLRSNDAVAGLNLHNVASVSTSITNSNDATR